MAAALWGPNEPPPLVKGGGMAPVAVSWPMLDFPVSRRVRLGANDEEIILPWSQEKR